MSTAFDRAHFTCLLGCLGIYRQWLWMGCVLLLGGIFLQGCSEGSSPSAQAFYNGVTCDAESLNGNSLRAKGFDFTGGTLRSNETAHSGSYAVKLTTENRFGLGINFNDLNVGDTIMAGVWRNIDKGYGALVIEGPDGIYVNTKKPDKKEGDWDHVQLQFVIPPGYSKQLFKLYAYNNQKEGTAYFDDVWVKIRPGTQKVAEVEAYHAPRLELVLPEKSMQAIKDKRAEAFTVGNLIVGKKDFVPGTLQVEGKELAIEARLKGDLLDHLAGDKWSFRLLLEGDGAWRGMREFSLHTPAARDYVREWLLHELCFEQGVLTTQYDFVQFTLNDQDLGAYAYEEFFRQSLLDRYKFPKGPMVRFNEDGLWLHAGKQLEFDDLWFAAADVKGFGRQEKVDDKQLRKALSLLMDLKSGQYEASQLFDIDYLGKYLALVDIAAGYHAIQWKNIRFYYHVDSAKLYPILYDAYPAGNDGPYLGFRVKYDCTPLKDGEHCLMHQLFRDEAVVASYHKYLQQFSDPAFIDDFMERHEQAIAERTAFLQQEFKDYHFPFRFIQDKAADIRKHLQPLEEVSLKVYREGEWLKILCYHGSPIEIAGFGGKTRMSHPLRPHRIIMNYQAQQPPPMIKIKAPVEQSHVYYQLPGIPVLYRVEIQQVPFKGMVEKMRADSLPN